MKRLFQAIFVSAFLLLLFLFTTPLKNNALAVTCSAAGGTCAASGVCNAEGNGRIGGTTGCTSTQVCCIFNPLCTSVSGQSCYSSTCSSLSRSTPTSSYYCPYTSKYCCGAKIVKCSTLAPSGYTSACTPSSICTAEGNGTISGATDCVGSVCCKFKKPTCASLAPSGYTASCKPGSQCSSSNNLGTADCTSGTVCCKVAPTYTCQDPNFCTGSAICVSANDLEKVTGKTCASGVCCKTIAAGTCTGYCDSSGTCPADRTSASGQCNPSTYACCSNTTSNNPGNPDYTTSCPVCTGNYIFDPYAPDPSKPCLWARDENYIYAPPSSTQTCQAGELCTNGCGCNTPTCPNAYGGFTQGNMPCGANGSQCPTALGVVQTDAASLSKTIFNWILSIIGGIAVLLIIMSGYRVIASRGNPEKLQGAREQLAAAIIGLLFVVLAFSILRFIGVDVLGIFPSL